MKRCIVLVVISLLPVSMLYTATFRITANPCPRSYSCMITDSINARMILFGGMNVGMPGGQYFNDVWSLDLNDEVWHLVEPSGPAPSPRIEAAAVYNPVGNEMIIFGGRAGDSYYNDIWSLDLTMGSEAWTQLSPIGTPPSPRTCAKTIIDPINNRMIMFGGSTITSGFDETWSLDLNTLTWSLLNPSGTPPAARFAHCAIYEPNGHQMVIFAGSDWGQPIMSDVWSLDLTYGSEAWQQLFPGGEQPGPRTQHFCIHDPINNDMIIGFGYDYPPFINYNDIWALDFNSLAWNRIFPQGMNVEGRRASSAAHDPFSHQIVIFGGNQANTYYFGDTYVVTLDSLGVSQIEKIAMFNQAYINILGNPTQLPCQFEIFVPFPGNVSLKVFDATGRLINSLIQDQKSHGNYLINWDGIDHRGRKVSAGSYYVVLETDGELIQQKAVLVE